MAKMTAEIKVSVEQAIHKAMADLVQDISEEYGIYINDAHFDWLDVSSTGERTLSLTEVWLETRAYAKTK
jgi:hypothetical protein